MGKLKVIDESKLQRQEQFITTWVNNRGVGTLEAVTAFGKTYTTILIIKRMLEKNNDRHFVIVVPTIQLKEQWIKSLLSEGIAPKNFYVTVINGLTINGKILNCSCLILDEIHLYLNGDVFSQVFNLVKYKFILGLSATIDRLSPGYNIIRSRCPVIDTITQQEAISKGWVASYKEFVLSVKLDEESRDKLLDIDNQFKKNFSKFDFDFDLAMNCASNKVMSYNFAINRGWKPEFGQNHPWSPSRIAFYSVQFGRSMRERKEFLYNYPKKKDLCKELVDKLNVKTIIFSESTQFVDELAQEIGDKAAAYHSNLKTEIRQVRNRKGELKAVKFGKDRLKKERLAKFEDNRSKITVLVTAKAVNQGTDLPSTQFGLMASYTSSTLTSIQRRGRVIRKFVNKYGQEKKAIVVYLAIEDSQEEKWLKKALQFSTPIWTTSIDYIVENAFTMDSIVQSD